MKKVSLPLIITAMSLVLNSNLSFAYDGWSIGKIDKIRYQGVRTLVTQLGATNPKPCGDPSYIVLIEDGSDFKKQVNAMLLAAQVSGKTVYLALNGCSLGGAAGYPVISEAWITNE